MIRVVDIREITKDNKVISLKLSNDALYLRSNRLLLTKIVTKTTITLKMLLAEISVNKLEL